MPFRKWTSIKKLSDVVINARRQKVAFVTYRSKIKLHGTNAAIRMENGEFLAQKRTTDLFPETSEDKPGFARFVYARRGRFNYDPEMEGMVFFGEWAGPGIHPGDAVNKIPQKTFFIFAARKIIDVTPEFPELTDEQLSMFDDDAFANIKAVRKLRVIYEPQELEEMVNHVFGQHPDIKVIPWHSEPVKVDLTVDDRTQLFLDSMMEEIEKIGGEDPYIKDEYDISGPGEGLVFYPLDNSDFSRYVFKLKHERHTVQKVKKVKVIPERTESISAFIDMFFTENRFNQMLNEHMNGQADKKNTGDFLRYVMQDVHSESANEREVSGLEWKSILRFAQPEVRGWFLRKAEEK